MNTPPVASERTVTRIYRAAGTPAVVVAGLELGANLLLAFLTVLATGASKCTGRHLIEDHRVAMLDLMALPLFSALVLWMVVLWARRPETRQIVEELDVVVFELSFVRITYGVFLAYSVLLGILGMSGSTVIISALRYGAVSKYCSASLGLAGGLA